MGKLFIISNRLPVNITKHRKKLIFNKSIGGLATGIGSLYKSYKSIWIGWPGIEPKGSEIKKIVDGLKTEKCEAVFLTQNDIDNYYNGFCNKTIWPLFHYFNQYTLYDEALWKSYVKVNEIFCQKILETARPDDIFWIHDYQLMLLPKMLREKLPNATIGFFLHIPFPSYETFRLLPWRKEIVEGLMGSDLIGFHTYGYVRNFIETTSRLLGYEQKFGQIFTDERSVKIDAFPMGIDYDSFSRSGDNEEVQEEINRIRKRVGNKKVILSVDRLDYTKGIIQRLEAFDNFLDRNPDYKDRVTLVLVAVPTRSKMEQYILLKRKIDEIIGRINGKHGRIGSIPIIYMYRTLSTAELHALYNTADISLVTPLRDGMNLMAKEFLASRKNKDGVLILSEMAGASRELSESLIVNPNNINEMSDALKKAVDMKIEEQIERNTIMQERIKQYDVSFWANDFLKSLTRTKATQKALRARRFKKHERAKLLSEYRESKNRLIFLDYDGTLSSFKDDPEKAAPDMDLLKLLRTLTNDTSNKVFIVSGRDRDTLTKWFGGLNIGLIAEHGAWIKHIGSTWKMTEHFNSDWKNKIKRILEIYTNRTPGSFVEEKEFSLAWHYRKADADLGSDRASELKQNITNIISNFGLNILDGNKVLEVRNSGINKGRSVLNILMREKSDFIIAIGDDKTDEDMFSVLPKDAYSFKVGFISSRSRFNLNSVKDVRELLKQMSGTRAIELKLQDE